METTEDKNAVSPEELAMLELVARKRGVAKDRHFDVPEVDANPSLSDFFYDEKYSEVLELLKTQTSKRYQDMPLVTPGNIAESAYYLQITEGVMEGQFSESEILVVRNWIESL